MGNWYGTIKIANSLAKSLGIDPDLEIYKDIQKYEHNLKSDGNWQNVLQLRKSKGVVSARRMLEEIIEGYKAERVNDRLLDSGIIQHIKTTVTGGDWYLIPGDDNFLLIDGENTNPDLNAHLKNLLKQKVDALRDLSCGGGWCISQGDVHQATYLKQGNSFLVLRRDKKPRIAVVFKQRGGTTDITEVQGTGNEFENINSLDALDINETPIIDDIGMLHDAINSQEIEKLREEGVPEEDLTFDAESELEHKAFYIKDEDLKTKELQEAWKEENYGQINGIKYLAKNALKDEYKIKSLILKLNPMFDGNHNFIKNEVAYPIIKNFQENSDPLEIINTLVNLFGKGTWVFTLRGKEETIKKLISNINPEDLLRYFNTIDSFNDKYGYDIPESLFAKALPLLEKVLSFQVPDDIKNEILEKGKREIYNRDFLQRSSNQGMKERLHELIRSQEEFNLVVKRSLSNIGVSYFNKLNGIKLLTFYKNALEFLPEYASLEELERIKNIIANVELDNIIKGLESMPPVPMQDENALRRYQSIVVKTTNELKQKYALHPEIVDIIMSDPRIVQFLNPQKTASWYGRKK